MFRRFQRFFTQLKVLLDVAVLGAAFGLAYTVRFWSPGFLPFQEKSPWNNTLRILGTVVLLYPLVIHGFGLYRAARIRSFLDDVFGLFKAWLLASMGLITVTYFFQPVRYSRLVLAFFFALSLLLLVLERWAFRRALQAIRRRGYNLKDVLVIGAGELGRRVLATLHDHRELGFRVAGVLTRHPEKIGSTVDGAAVLGELADLEEVMGERHIDQVVIALPLEEQGALRGLMAVLSESTADVKIVPDLVQYVTLSGGVEEFGGLPLLSLQHGPLGGWNGVMKRLFDVVFSALALLVAAPAMLFCAVGVELSSAGPILYGQERVGLDGRRFRALKFRTMQVDAETEGARMAVPGDPRTTRFGAWLRRTSLDELPQLWNILRGEMSLVGPRPERPVFIEEFKKQIPRYQLRHKVKAGLTGWAQVNGLRGQSSIEKRIEYDLYYIENWSLWLDVKILARTVAGGFLSKNAY
ncbi:MAG: undecaprenyl-phosphate glucose phosphotransferase [Myxococcales bacterium]